MNAAVAAYREVHRASLVESKSPHQLTLMLFDGALARIAAARELDPFRERSVRYRALDRALAIVQELQGSLREPETDELAGQLFALYAHVIERLIEAGRTSSNEPLASAVEVLDTLRDGWVRIDPVERS